MQNNMDKKAKTDKEVAAILNEEVRTGVRVALQVVRDRRQESITEQKDARRREQGNKMKSERSERQMKRHNTERDCHRSTTTQL